MNIGEYSVRSKVVSWLIVIVLVGGGLSAYEGMGKLEDPPFTIKNAKVITYYPGASSQEVQDEVTYHVEDAIQRMEQVKFIKMSISRPGMSDIMIEFKDKYKAEDFPGIYDELRRKITDMEHKLPPGAQKPIVVDEFADVYGVYVALTGDGYSWRDLWNTADYLKRELVLVPGVRKISIGGEQQEVVYLEMSRSRLAELGIPLDRIGNILQSQNVVADAGQVRVDDQYLRIKPTGAFQSVKAIGDVLIGSDDKKLIFLRDIAEIKRAYIEVHQLQLRQRQAGPDLGYLHARRRERGRRGRRHRAALAEIKPNIPLGMELQPIYNQPAEVEKSVSGFIVSVGQAVAIVIIVLLVFMGIKVGLIIGAVLLITVAGTLMLMAQHGIELQRISLGGLIIALGMLVDNAIVVAEGMLIRIRAGMDPAVAARETVGKTIWALLGGTIIGIVAFSAIGLSPDKTGEFANSLFWVILYSLLLSWVTAISTTPLLCALLLKPDKDAGSGEQADPYGGGFFKVYRGFVDKALRFRWITVGVVVAMFVAALIGFGSVKQAFFPESNTPIFLRRSLGAPGYGHPQDPGRYPSGSRIPAKSAGRRPDHFRGGWSPPAVHPGVRPQGSGRGVRPDHRTDGDPGADPGDLGRGGYQDAGRDALTWIPS